MDDFAPLSSAVEPTAPPYKDRSTGLTIFGILTVLLGCVSGLFIPLILFSQVMASRTHPEQTNFAAIVPGLMTYALLAVMLVWLGIGSMLARRWARALLLIFSWSWLLIGIIVTVVMALVLPNALHNLPTTRANGHPPLPPTAMEAMMVIMFLFFSFIFILLPAIWTFFYNGRDVKATCEARDKVPGWTDACPLPVLALSLWLIYSVPMMLALPFSANGVMPFFGTFLSGLPGMILCVVIAALWSYLAWLIYKVKALGWWLLLIVILAFAVSSGLTFARHDALEMYQLMGYPQAQIDQIQKSGMLTGNWIQWATAFSMVPFLGYLLFVKKYFRGSR